MSPTMREMKQEFENDLKGLIADECEAVGKDEVQKNKYQRSCKGVMVDVYDVLKAFHVVNPATQHAIKKLLASGKRGYKGVKQDLKEARDSISRAIELEE